MVQGRRIDLGRARREAKRLLTGARDGEPEAVTRLLAHPSARLQREGMASVQLSDAQFAVARELGAASWERLAEGDDFVDRFVRAATSDRRDHAERLLAERPEVWRERADAALVLGADVDVAAGEPLGLHGWLPLQYVTHSVFAGDAHVELARRLLEAGADPNAGVPAPLYGAAGRAHHPGLTALLLEHGAQPDDDESLYHAVEARDDACLRLLLDAGATVAGTNALAHALDREDPDRLELLLDHGPAAGEPWAERDSALHWAVMRQRSPETLRLLVERGVAVDEDVYARALHAGRPDLAETLAALGAPRGVRPVSDLLDACMRGDRSTARALAASRPEAVERLRAEHPGAVAGAAGQGRFDAVAILLDLGQPLGAALQEAAYGGWADLVAFLLERGADVHGRGPHGGTPLAYAAHGSWHAPREGTPHGGEWARVAELLIDAGAEGAEELAEHVAAPELAEWLRGGGVRHPRVSYGELGWDVTTAYLRALRAVGETRPAGDGFAVKTGDPSNSENGVVADDVDDVAAVVEWFGGVPAQWHIGPDSDLGPRLEAAGCEAENTAVVMGAPLARLNPTAWGRALGVRVVEQRERAVAHRGDEVVGHVTWFLHGTTLYLLDLEVAPEQRRQGIGRTLLAHALRAEAEHVVLGPTPDSLAFFRRLGFTLQGWPPGRSFYLPVPR